MPEVETVERLPRGANCDEVRLRWLSGRWICRVDVAVEDDRLEPVPLVGAKELMKRPGAVWATTCPYSVLTCVIGRAVSSIALRDLTYRYAFTGGTIDTRGNSYSTTSCRDSGTNATRCVLEKPCG